MSKGPRDARFEQVSKSVNFSRCSCLSGYFLRVSTSAWRACTAGDREKACGRDGAIGDRGRRFLVQHNIESQVYIARSIYVGGTGGVTGGSGVCEETRGG